MLPKSNVFFNFSGKEVRKVSETKDSVVAVVQKIVSDGKHGSFAVATADALEGSITFSLEPTVWQEQGHPEAGEMVYLTDIRMKRAGWRAKKGRYYNPSDEKTATRKEQEMMKRAKTFIEGLKGRWFPTADDKAWRQWVDFKNRETRDLVELLTSDVRESLKRRAVFLLLVPSAEFNPIYWKEEVGKFYHRTDFLNSLTPTLLGYAVDLIVEFCTMLRPMHCDRPKHYAQGGGGITVYTSVPDKYHDALYFYNHCILILLSLVSMEEGERIFPLYSLNDISTFCNMDDASGYTPFQNLMYAKGVDESWKKRADAEMRRIIQAEVAGTAKPREDWENALKCYAYTLRLQLYSETMCYSIDLFADQMQFLVDESHYGHDLVDSWKLPRIFKVLAGMGYEELRYRIVKFVVAGSGKEFSVYDSDGLMTAKLMLSVLGEGDQDLIQKVRTAIEEGKKRSAERQNEQVTTQKTEENIMSQMR